MKNGVRFTDRASSALKSARDAAASLGHGYVGTEHLLLGVAAQTEGLGARVLAAGIEAARRELGAQRIRIEAQSYAQGFYEKAGFVRCTDEFDEDGIPHVGMVLES